MASYSETLAATQAAFADSQERFGVKRFQGLLASSATAGTASGSHTFIAAGHFGQPGEVYVYYPQPPGSFIPPGARGQGR